MAHEPELAGGQTMPYVNIKITREGATAQQKAELIKGVTELLVRVLDKTPATTFVVIDEVATEDWGVAGVPVKEFRQGIQQQSH
ncbi:MAG: 4-oxalocrotonate tautomerase family protein [Cyanobacteria bacterium CRU_2_1]|nr:4-oxalocrotonate tautomerase family protein [Cyanobacteria bacterium CRU_2_1]